MIERVSNKCKHLESMPSQDSGEVEACCKVASELTNTTPRAETINLGKVRYLNGFLLPSPPVIGLWIIDSETIP